MKSLKFFIVNALIFIIGLSLVSGTFSNNAAEAAPTELVPKIQVQKVGGYRGQYLTAFYAVGTHPFLATDSRQVTLSEVKEIRTVQIDGDSVVLPPVELQKQGFRPGYNLVLFVISPDPDFSFVNPDGSAITSMPATSNHRISAIEAVFKTDLEALAQAQGRDNEIILSL